MKIAVYLAAVPQRNKQEAKRQYLTDFAYGAKAAGDDVWLVDEHQIIDSDIAVLQGWVGMKQAPHLRLRQAVIKQQRKMGKHVLVMDSNLYGFIDPKDKDRYLRYSLNGIFPTTGYYFTNHVDPQRWDKIKAAYQWQERPWRQNGQYILMCLQRNGGWSMDGYSVIDWITDTLPKIRANTDRPILLRAHPSNQNIIGELRLRWPELQISRESDIRDDFGKAWAVITYNSSPGVAGLMCGVPTWVTDPEPRRSQAYPTAFTDLGLLEKHELPDRRDFYCRLAQSHFNWEEVKSGQAWTFMRARLP